MKTLFLTIVLLSGCAAVDVGGTTCHMNVAGDIDSRIDQTFLKIQSLQQAMDRFIYSTLFVTDPRFILAQDVCRQISGYRVYTNKNDSFWIQNSDGTRDEVLGYTRCTLKMIVIGTPRNGDWRSSSLVHQMFHAAQGCQTPLPIDQGVGYEGRHNRDHSNWVRAGIFNAINYANKREQVK